jgi:TolB-like protein/Flp pilus assembly protein TadD
MPLPDLFSELRRRRVFRVAGVYAAVAFVVWQAADIAFPALRLPEWLVTAVVAFTILGFPIALVLAWAFEITPEGVRRTEPLEAGAADGGGPARGAAGRRWSGQRIAATWGAVSFLILGGAFIALGDRKPGDDGMETDRSVAVLPFASLSADADNLYFASGIHEEVLTQLSKIAELRVLSRSSVQEYGSDDHDLRRIGERLGVGAILQGSVQRAGNRVRVSARLVDARTERHLWAESYDRELADIFAIQSEIALQIAAALRANLSSGERERIQRQATGNLAAYDLYLRGLELYATGRDENETAVELFRQAIRLDPEFAAAHAQLSASYMQRVQTYGFPREWADSGVVVARRAIAVDPALANGYWALGTNLNQLGRTSEARRALERAVELDPSFHAALIGLAVISRHQGRYDEELRWAQRAILVDPTSPFSTVHHALAYWFLGDAEQAVHWLERTRQVSPNFPWTHLIAVYLEFSTGRTSEGAARAQRWLDERPGDFVGMIAAADAAFMMGRFGEAAERYERLLRAAPDGMNTGNGLSFRTSLSYALLRTGQRERGEEFLTQALEENRKMIGSGADQPSLFIESASIHAIRGDRAAALDALERAYQGGWREHATLHLMPMLEILRTEERYQRLVASMRADVSEIRSRV